MTILSEVGDMFLGLCIQSSLANTRYLTKSCLYVLIHKYFIKASLWSF